jgi:PKD repeat protein
VSVIPQGGFTPYTYTWTPSSLGITNTGYLGNMPAGSYSVTVTDSLNCSHWANFNINQPDSIFYSFAPFDPKCHGDANGSILFSTYNGVPPFDYLWSNGETTPSIMNLTEGIYSVTATDQNGCEVITSDTLNEPDPLLLTVSGDIYICQGQNITLFAQASGGTPAYFYNWSNGASGPQIGVNPTTNTIYTVQVRDLNNCLSEIKQIAVYVYPAISVQLQTLNDSICVGESTIIHAQILGGTGGPYTTIWSDGSNTQLLPPPYTVSPVQTTEYEIWVQDFCGSPTGYFTMTIHVFDEPEVEISSNIIEGCRPLTVAFNEVVSPAGSQFEWDFGDGDFDIQRTKRNPVHTFINEGPYDITLSVISPVGCKNTVTMPEMIHVFTVPVARFYPQPAETSNVKPIIFFDNVSTGASVSTWDFGDNTPLSNSIEPEHYYANPGEYLVQLAVENPFGCRDTFYQSVLIRNEYTFYTANAFNPNSDIPENRTFMPIGLGIDPSHFHMIIFDRFGNKLYETFDVYRPWNGDANGKKADAGETYSWIVIYRDINGQERRESGTVTIVK